MTNEVYERLLGMLMSDDREMLNLALVILVEMHDIDPYIVTVLKNNMVTIQRFEVAASLRDIERGEHKLQRNEI